MKNLQQLIIPLIIFGIATLPTTSVFAVSTMDDGTSNEGNRASSGCYGLRKVEMTQNGYFRVSFGHTNYSACSRTVYYVDTFPTGKIRGVQGIKGTSVADKLTITVEPDTQAIDMEMAGKYGALSLRRFKITDYIRAAKRENSGWQEAWKQSEEVLKETAAKDKTPPEIILRSPDVTPQRKLFRVDTYQTFIRGKVDDDAGVATVLVNGLKAGVKADGSFAKKVKLAIGINKIKVQAADIHGNVAERNFTMMREEFISDEIIADVDIPQKTSMNNPDAVGVVIGVEAYQYVADATYAYNDAEVFREYLADTLGFKKSRIKLATNSKATQAELSKLLGPNGWIARNVISKKSDVVVYFSGHGIPDAKTKKTGLLPFDVDPNYSVGLTLESLYKTLGNLDARSVTVFLDACFSGQGREKQILLADTRGIQVVPIESNIPNNVTVFSAATAGQVSGPIKNKEHGLFTYYVLKGLSGDADANKNRELTTTELGEYVHEKVKAFAALNDREQTPELQSASRRVLLRW